MYDQAARGEIQSQAIQKLVDNGIAEEEASKIVGISPKKARAALGVDPGIADGETPVCEQK